MKVWALMSAGWSTNGENEHQQANNYFRYTIPGNNSGLVGADEKHVRLWPFRQLLQINNSRKSNKISNLSIFNWKRKPGAEDISKAHTKTNLSEGKLHIALPSKKPDITEKDVAQCDIFDGTEALLNGFDDVRSTSSARQLHFTLICWSLIQQHEPWLSIRDIPHNLSDNYLRRSCCHDCCIHYKLVVILHETIV